MLNGGAAVPVSADERDRLFAPLAEAAGVLLAVSGGPDSMALLGLAAEWRESRQAPRIAVATVDHGLRPGSAAEAGMVAAAAEGFGLTHAVLSWAGPKPATRLQEAAREARYALLTGYAAANGLTHLVTAHTADDQAETVLFRISRGSGPAGLIGMRGCVARGPVRHVRPLLGVRKWRLMATCRERGWPFVDDPSNRDPRFARVRWRRLASALDAEGLTAERIGVLSRRLARSEAALDTLARGVRSAALLESGDARQTYDAACLREQPLEILLRVLSFALAETGADRPHPSIIRLQRLEALGEDVAAALLTGRRLSRSLAGAVVSTRPDGILVVSREPARRAAAWRQNSAPAST